MSAPTVLHVLDRAPAARPAAPSVVTAPGPGFTASTVMLRPHDPVAAHPGFVTAQRLGESGPGAPQHRRLLARGGVEHAPGTIR
jgi:hypothetical protein